MKSLATSIIKRAQELQKGWNRITIILQEDVFERLKTISDIKGIFIKDIVNDLIKIYNEVAVTSKDRKKIREERKKLEQRIKSLIKIQESEKEKEEES